MKTIRQVRYIPLEEDLERATGYPERKLTTRARRVFTNSASKLPVQSPLAAAVFNMWAIASPWLGKKSAPLPIQPYGQRLALSQSDLP